jgi:LmbE family N-acetylglucosaminyl deacetylase
VVAHPDDETIGCGIALSKMNDPLLVHVTEGVPLHPDEALRAEWGRTRTAELTAALKTGGLDPVRAQMRLVDGQVVHHLSWLADQLVEVLAGCARVYTHAYQGGHQDHDSVNMAVRKAIHILRGAGAVIEGWEMPFYHMGDKAWVYQSFADPTHEQVLNLTPEESARKKAMLNCFQSQWDILAPVETKAERFRPMQDVDVLRLPNDGRCIYAGTPWGMDSDRWLELAAQALLSP